MTTRIKQWNQNHSYKNTSLFTDRLKKLGLEDQQIEGILEIMDTICTYCYDNDHPCHCMNDE